MSDLISRQKAKDAIDMALDHIDHVPSWVYDNLLNALNALPSVQPRKGKWELCGNHHLCSECDEWAFAKWDDDECDEVDVLTDFCPNCGADMRGEQNE